MVTHLDGLSGIETVTLPDDAVRECSASGPVDDAVAFWVTRVTWHATDADLRAMLRECGAWDDLATADTDTLRARALWVAACDIKERY